MARKAKVVSVYDRILEQKEKIQSEEKVLKQLNEELQLLYKEKDDLEMKQLFEHAKSNGFTIQQAMELLNHK